MKEGRQWGGRKCDGAKVLGVPVRKATLCNCDSLKMWVRGRELPQHGSLHAKDEIKDTLENMSWEW